MGTLTLQPAMAGGTTATWSVRRIATIEEFLTLAHTWQGTADDAFAQADWLRAWYGSLAPALGAEPLLLAVRRGGATQDDLLLPWVLLREHGHVVARFADGGITDYNAPLLREGFRLSPQERPALRRALLDALAGADLLDLAKMPARIGHVEHPLVGLFDAPGDELFGNRFELPELYGDWMTHLGKHARKEFERCWRVFQRHEGARFVRASTVEEGLELLSQLSALQRERLGDLPAFQLDRPGYEAFYQRYLRENLASGRCVVTALMVGPYMVAGLYSVFDGTRFTMLRIAMAGPSWKTCAPGKLLLERSIHAMHAEGCRAFDFSIGDYRHKHVFRTTPWPLHEACRPLTVLGVLPWLRWQLRRQVRARPALRRWLQRWRSPPAAVEAGAD